MVFNFSGGVIPSEYGVFGTKTRECNEVLSLWHIHRLSINPRWYTNQSPTSVAQRHPIYCLLHRPVMPRPILRHRHHTWCHFQNQKETNTPAPRRRRWDRLLRNNAPKDKFKQKGVIVAKWFYLCKERISIDVDAFFIIFSSLNIYFGFLFWWKRNGGKWTENAKVLWLTLDLFLVNK